MEKKSVGLFPLLRKGALFGIANIIPGVSGGTIAVVTGVYDNFINAVGHPAKEWRFLLLYFIGAAIGILGGTFTIKLLFEYWPGPTILCFMGFIAGSLPVLWKTSKIFTKPKAGWIFAIILAMVSIVLLEFFVHPSTAEAVTSLTTFTGIRVFIAGMLAAAAMVVPGISGAFILLLLGMYTTAVNAVTSLNFPLLICLGAGTALGVVVTAKLIGYFLEHFHETTYAVIIGLVCGSLITLWPGIPDTLLLGIISIITFAAGFAAAFFLGTLNNKQ
ncbi:MAG: DUF368 domain-containing protein [Spirochaetia bacterium]